MKKNPPLDLEQFIAKLTEAKSLNQLDLSSDQDLSIAIMNLVGIEEHLFFTGAKTGKSNYYDLIKDVRAIRTALLKKMIKEYEGEVWCISKHLLAASYRLMEVGTKQLGRDHKAEAYEMFEKAYNLYSLFWGLNMNLIGTDGIQKISDEALDVHDQGKDGVMKKLGTVVKKIVNCCLE